MSGLPAAGRQLRAWARRPVRTVAPWLVLSAAIGLGLLGLVWLVASVVPPDTARPRGVPFRAPDDTVRAFWFIVERNSVVLALHATACLAGYIVHAATRAPSADPDLLERVTTVTARVAFLWVPVATLLSIGTQAWVLGSYASTLSTHLFLSPARLLVTTAPHALLELTAVFLPLAAWLVALRRRQLGELYAATIASVLVALPLILAAAWIEADQWYDRVQRTPIERPHLEGVRVGTFVDRALVGDAIRVEFGERIAGARTARFDDAAAEADRRTRGGAGAVAIVELGAGHELYRLRAVDGSSPCGGDFDDTERALRGEDFDGRVVGARTASVPGTVVDLDVDALVDSPIVLAPDLARPPAGLVAQCDPARAGAAGAAGGAPGAAGEAVA